jgi:hypothetical protein
MKCSLVYSSVIVLAFASGMAEAAVSYFDPFTDGVLRGGTDSSGIDWFDRSASASIGAFNDNGPNTLNSATLRFATMVANRGFVGVLIGGPITLGAPGDYVTLSFSFRVSGTLNSNAQGFTFGLYDSNGTPVTGDDTTQSDNDRGYRGQFATGSTGGVSIIKEENNVAGGLGTGTGTESLAVTLSSSTPVAITSSIPHTASMTLTYNSLNSLGIVLYYDGVKVADGTSTSPFFSFDEVVFSQGGSNNLVIDDVSVISNVPEPGVAGLLLMSAVGCLIRRSRRG